MIDALKETVLRNGRPFLGICVGMQLMATAGREFGVHPGLNWIEGDVVPVKPADPALKIPHMGWNEIEQVADHALFAGLEPGANAYYVHSFEMKPADRGTLLATTNYGGAVTAALFLKEFSEDTPWVHLDIAGTAWLDENKPFLAKGPSGVAVRTLVRLAMDWKD